MGKKPFLERVATRPPFATPRQRGLWRGTQRQEGRGVNTMAFGAGSSIEKMGRSYQSARAHPRAWDYSHSRLAGFPENPEHKTGAAEGAETGGSLPAVLVWKRCAAMHRRQCLMGGKRQENPAAGSLGATSVLQTTWQTHTHICRRKRLGQTTG